VKAIGFVFPLCLALGAAQAADRAVLTRQQVADQLPGVEASDIADSPIPGLYQVSVGPNVAYVTSDGKYVLQGDLYEVASQENLTEKSRAAARKVLLDAVGKDSMIVFSPKNGQVKHRVTVFTDVDCGYCRQFHRDIDKVTALGIEVHYLFFPRTGPNTESWKKAERVWCAKDRNAALTEAKLGAQLPKASCSTPVEKDYNLGKKVGVRGTPAIFSESGELLGGYLPPKKLAAALNAAD
jgi:thiol:disulfide interchange protein DsbC